MEKKHIITCLKKIKKIKEYQKNYCEAKKHASQMKSKSVLQIYFLFVLLLVFKKIKMGF